MVSGSRCWAVVGGVENTSSSTVPTTESIVEARQPRCFGTIKKMDWSMKKPMKLSGLIDYLSDRHPGIPH